MSKTPKLPPKLPQGGDPKEVANKLKQSFHKNPTTKLLAGVGSGFLSGMITRKVGRVPIALIGTSIVLFQAAQTHGLIKHTWDDVKAKADAAKKDQQGQISKVRQFALENPAFTAGFTGGFLIGLTF